MQCSYPANPDDGSAHDLIAIETAFDGIDAFHCQQRCLADPHCKSFQYGYSCEIFNKTIKEGGIRYNRLNTNLFFDRNCPQYQSTGCPARDHLKRVPANPTASQLTTLPPSEISSICTCLISVAPTAVTKTIIDSLILSAVTTETFSDTIVTTYTAHPKNLISWTKFAE